MIPASAAGLAAVWALHDHPVVRRVAATTREVPAHLVGGMIRDAWLGRPTCDVDVVVAGQGRGIAHRLAAVLPARFVALGGKEFAAFRLVGDGFHLDIWDRQATTLEEDLARRDFTVNSIALDLARRGPEALVDPHLGVADLERRRLRATTEASFEEDPLRVLRLSRFVVELSGFSAEGATRGLARRAAAGVARVAAERVRAELGRILAGADAHRGFEEMAATALYPGLLLDRPGDPELTGPAERTAARLVAELRALPAAVEGLRRLAAEVAPTLGLSLDLPAARLAAAVVHLPTQDAVAALKRLHDRGYLSQRELEPVRPLVEQPHLPPVETGITVAARRFLHRQGRMWATALALAGARASCDGETESWEVTSRRLLTLMAGDGDRILDPPRLLGGGEVRRLLGITPGPEVGRALAAVRRAQVDGTIQTRDEAEALISSLSETFRKTSGRLPSAAD